ncbi:hypothetical protein [Algisphaera agarilytica]|uniref:Uncharacterized protein n=1 Tax=Algisphaera agarilytica TaxID=1385975 RepID=A0A7X0H549_9BACT|nr:hypothetical protein [Algisphaera agarilytica]MBB6429217.1 hypothetical protein [Algisphaera agarilytica]
MAKKKSELIEEAKKLGIEGADDMTVAQLEVAIEEASETKIKIFVKDRVITANAIEVPAGEHELSAHELAASGLREDQYTVVE